MPIRILKAERNGEHQVIVMVGAEDAADVRSREARDLALRYCQPSLNRPGFAGDGDWGYRTAAGKDLSEEELKACCPTDGSKPVPLPLGGLHTQEYKVQGVV